MHVLQISASQMRGLYDASLRRHARELGRHARSFSPALCGPLDDDRLDRFVGDAVRQAARHGLTTRGPVRLYLEATCLFGSRFDTDPQYAALGSALRADAGQAERAARLYDIVVEYLEQVVGPDRCHESASLRSIVFLVDRLDGVAWEGSTDELPSQLPLLYPRKAAFMGSEAMIALIEQARRAAIGHGFCTERAHLLFALLMFAFGHGCLDDPLHAWIATALEDARLAEDGMRLAGLERVAIGRIRLALDGSIDATP